VIKHDFGASLGRAVTEDPSMEVISDLISKFGQIWPAEVRGSLLERPADVKA